MRRMTTTFITKQTESEKAIQFANIWRNFIHGGLTGDFLTNLLSWKVECGREPIHQFVDEGFQSILRDKAIESAGQKILLGYLTAIKGVHFKKHAFNDLNVVLASSRNVQHHLNQLNEGQRTTISASFNFLLDNTKPIVAMEEIFQKEYFNSAVPHNTTPPTPFNTASSVSSSERKRRGAGSSQEKYINPAFEDPISSASTLKLITNLTTKLFEVFPVLMSVTVDRNILSSYIKDLVTNQHTLSASRLIIYYPDLITLQDVINIQKLIEPENIVFFAETQAWLYEFYCFYHSNLAIVDESSRTRLEMLGVLREENDNSHGSRQSSVSRSKQLFSRLKAAIQHRNTVVEPSFLTVPRDELKDHFNRTIENFIEVETNLGYQAAEILSNCLEQSPEKVQEEQAKFKLRKLIVKGGWQLACQKATTLKLQIYLFQYLKQKALFLEARNVYLEKRLDMYQLKPVTLDEINFQKKQDADHFVQFPGDIPIVIVDSLDTLQQMADEFDIPLLPQNLNHHGKASTAIDQEISKLLEELPVNDGVPDSGEMRKPGKKANYLTRVVLNKLIRLYGNYYARKMSSEQFLIHQSEKTVSETENLELETVATTVDSSSIAEEEPVYFFRKIIGLDSEWKVEMYKQGETADILQIATPQTAYIVDLYKIFEQSTSKPSGNPSSPPTIDSQLQKSVLHVLRTIFQDKTILKLSFDLHVDLMMLNNVGNRSFHTAVQTIHSLIDLKGEYCNVSGGVQTKGNAVGLSTMCERYFGKQVNKSMRLSDWSKRPLTAEQLEYAALDAHILIGVFDAMLQEKGINIGLNLYQQIYKTQLPSQQLVSKSITSVTPVHIEQVTAAVAAELTLASSK